MSSHFGSQGEKALQKKYQTVETAQAFYKNQMIDYLTDEMISFIEEQEMLFVSTADKQGNCDNSFRYGESGFIKVIDQKRLLYPEYKGNGVNASLGNIFENPHIGLLLIDFYKNRVGLHINGKAEIVDREQLETFFNLEITDELLVNPFSKRWVVIEVEEAYIHCSKHIPLLMKVDKEIQWGTDDPIYKGGDFFKVKLHKKTSEKK